MPTDLTKIDRPWGPAITRAIEVDVSTLTGRTYRNDLGFFALPQAAGTVSIRLADAKDSDPTFDITIVADTTNKIIRLGDARVPLKSITSSDIDDFIVGWPGE